MNRPPGDGLSSLRDSGFVVFTGADGVAAWALVVAWVLVILTASGDGFSAARTASWLAWSLRIGFGEVAPDTFQLIHLIVRKTAHLVEYCILGLLVYRALFRTARGRVRTWWLAAAWSFPLLVAAIDELHQFHVPTRTGSVTDVGIDAVGAWLGLVVQLWSSARRNSIVPLGCVPASQKERTSR